MKIEVIYLHVSEKSSPDAPEPDYYTQFHRRFADTYKEYNAGIGHKLTYVFCGTEHIGVPLIEGSNCTTYSGSGWDIGAHQHVSVRSEADFVLCISTPAYFRERDWLVPFSEAFKKHGDGLYGAMGSNERMPHIRTSVYAFSPNTMRRYPWLISSRETCFHFECGFDSQGELFEDGSKNFTTWMTSQCKPVFMVTRDGCFSPDHWREPANIFRRGDQSNCLLWDRYNDLYAAADTTEKQRLAALADGVK